MTLFKLKYWEKYTGFMDFFIFFAVIRCYFDMQHMSQSICRGAMHRKSEIMIWNPSMFLNLFVQKMLVTMAGAYSNVAIY